MLDKVTTTEMAWAHEAGRQAARVYFEMYHAELTTDELERLLAVVNEKHITPKQTATHYDPSRNKLAAAMWLSGASLRQLGLAFGVTRETMLRAKDKVLLGNKQRMVQPNISFARVLVMRDFGLQFARNNVGIFSALEPVMIARMLQNIPDRADNESEQSAYDQHDPQTTLHKTEEASPERSESNVVATVKPMTAENFWDKMKGADRANNGRDG